MHGSDLRVSTLVLAILGDEDVNYYIALAGMAAWFLFGYWAGQRYERRRALVVVGDKRKGMPADDRCCRSALRDIERDIIRGKMPSRTEGGDT